MDTPTFRRMPLMTWLRLAAKADAEGVYLESAYGSTTQAFAVNPSHLNDKGEPVRYLVSEISCMCPAGQAGRDCKHRALYLLTHSARLGVFVEPDEAYTLAVAQMRLREEDQS